ncbi:MAG: pyridoxal-phosphate dependent enzyme [Saprospiraceae bacterium]
MMNELFEAKIPSPIQEINLPLLNEKNISLFIKRDDLIHPLVSGNKWRKLKYNIAFAKSESFETIVTFGGAFSNHIYAVAAACHGVGVKSVGFIRGDIDPYNPTLQFCTKMGMHLCPMRRLEFRLKEKSADVISILGQYPNAYVLPEGGTNELAIKGVSEMVQEIGTQDYEIFDFMVLAGGTGGTAAGLLHSDKLKSKILVFSALKSDFLKDQIVQLAKEKNKVKLFVNTDYHFGGYAKYNQELLSFISKFRMDTNIPLDHVYTGKAMFGLLDLIAKDYFTVDTKILFVHTGGLQGLAGLDYMQSKKRSNSKLG